MTGLTALTQAQLDAWVRTVSIQPQSGRLPDYIPLLATVDPNWFAVQVECLNGQTYAAGEQHCSFPLMSVIKPFVLLFLLEQLGQETVFSWVGMEPSDQPFHSLIQLASDRGFPRNPMINSGAIALAAHLPGKDSDQRCEHLRQWLNQQSGAQLILDQAMLASVRSLKNEANRAIAHTLAQAGYLNLIDLTLDTYNQICCLSTTVADLAKLGMLLVQPQKSIAPEHQRLVNALMLTCGLYEASGRFAVRIGVPTKSGVGGALLAVVPRQGAIACYSPQLDDAGNSVVGLALLQEMAQSLNLSVFGSATA
ncbi:glutaminase A [Pantanalinema sp. GBBB05]|uniref:glutaminase A n=1 Tax=Pantanalinema sp. GBBB05 TaxID=2604139 RepID=UPI001D1F7EE1|nr:glutaminase A [Pantanalinema sp. GBBB05]